jgi:hypothetical protein
MKSQLDIFHAILLAGVAYVGINATFSPSFKWDRRFYIPFCFFTVLWLVCKLAQHHIPPDQHYLKYLFITYEPLFSGSSIGIAIVAIATGGFSHKLMKVPKDESPQTMTKETKR